MATTRPDRVALRFSKSALWAMDSEEPKRPEIAALMKSHGYRRSHTWLQDDFYLPESPR
jgi:hypothetical protein